MPTVPEQKRNWSACPLGGRGGWNHLWRNERAHSNNDPLNPTTKNPPSKKLDGFLNHNRFRVAHTFLGDRMWSEDLVYPLKGKAFSPARATESFLLC